MSPEPRDPVGPVDLPVTRAPAELRNAEGRLVGVTVQAPRAMVAGWRRALLAYPMRDDGARRAAGINNQSQVLGFLGPSERLRRVACTTCNKAQTHPDQHAAVASIAGGLTELMAEHAPDGYAATVAASAAVLPDWRLPGGLFTSGIVNRDSALPYHFDRNNFAGAWSAMVVVRRGVREGHLHLPDLGVLLDCADGDVVLFEGSTLLHGVTPLRRVQRDGYRISAVFYAARRMATCGPPAEEARRAAELRTATDADLLERHREKGILPPA